MENFDFDLYENLIFPIRGRVLSSESLLNILGENIFDKSQQMINEQRRNSSKELVQVTGGLAGFPQEAQLNTDKKFSFKPSRFKPSKTEEGISVSEKGEDKFFSCSFEGCTKAYRNKSRLQIHERTHAGVKPFKCSQCEKSFNEKGNLMTHMRIHTGEKPYKCNYEGCRKEFKAYGHLSDHLKRHYNIRPFECPLCKYAFSRRNTLKTHMMTHTGEKPFVCSFPGCDKRFSEKGNMKTHYKTHLKKLLKVSAEKIEVNSPEFSINRCQEFSFLGKKGQRERDTSPCIETNFNSSANNITKDTSHKETHSPLTSPKSEVTPVPNIKQEEYINYSQLMKVNICSFTASGASRTSNIKK